ncbi:MAG: GNAT family N-acetyltransferase [Chlamydiae bacterium]|nr:GNAT family N-acetyltransferase [Chlamydiota bacterium]MBI3265496.1 GNAT family N-acetyltransferase [Chlamydiota bacterium]
MGKVFRVREATPSDRERIEEILKASKVFSQAEVACALSLFEIYLERGGADEYVFCCACDEADVVQGLICYGKASLTDAVYDLYWVVTHPVHQGRGIGSLLMEELDHRLKILEARMILAETSSRADYEKSRAFYRAHGYELVSTIQDYYALGEDLVVFGKRYP